MNKKQGQNGRSAVIISLVCAIIFCMGMGYSYVVKEKNSNQNKDYKIEVANVDAVVSPNSIAEVLGVEKNANKANLKMSFHHVKDTIIYTIEVINSGTGDAINIEDKTISGEAQVPVSYVVEGLSQGAIIKSGMSAIFTVTATYEMDGTIADNASVIKQAEVSLDCKLA